LRRLGQDSSQNSVGEDKSRTRILFALASIEKAKKQRLLSTRIQHLQNLQFGSEQHYYTAAEPSSTALNQDIPGENILLECPSENIHQNIPGGKILLDAIYRVPTF